MQRLATLLAVLTLLVTACGSETNTDSSTTSSTSRTGSERASWSQCANPEGDYSVEYPGDWETNDATVVPPCSVFHPEPFELAPATEIPSNLAVVVGIDNVSFSELQRSRRGLDVHDRQETDVAGRQAVRLQGVTTGEALWTADTPMTVWNVDLNGRTFIARSLDIGDVPYDRKVTVLDEMMESLRIGNTTSTSTSTTSAAAPADEGLQPLGTPQIGTISSADFPSSAGATTELADVRVARHDGFDRVVPQFLRLVVDVTH